MRIAKKLPTKGLILGATFALIVTVVAWAARTSPPSPDASARPFVVTESLRTEDGIVIPAGTEVMVRRDDSAAATQWLTLSLHAAPATISKKCRPITEKRDYRVLSYEVRAE